MQVRSERTREGEEKGSQLINSHDLIVFRLQHSLCNPAHAVRKKKMLQTYFAGIFMVLTRLLLCRQTDLYRPAGKWHISRADTVLMLTVDGGSCR